MWLRLTPLHHLICSTPQPELYHINTEDAVNLHLLQYEEQTPPRQTLRCVETVHLSRQLLM